MRAARNKRKVATTILEAREQWATVTRYPGDSDVICAWGAGASSDASRTSDQRSGVTIPLPMMRKGVEIL